MHTRTQYVGASKGMSVRVMKGVYLKSSEYRGERFKPQKRNPSALAVGRNKQKPLPLRPRSCENALKKIVNVQPYADGISVFTSASQNAKPKIFLLDDPFFAANLILLANPLD